MKQKINRKNEKIVICGNYGATNIGDEAICLSLVEQVRKNNKEAEIVVMSYDPAGTQKMLQLNAPEIKVKSVYLLPLGFRSLFRGIFKGELWRSLNTIRECDKFILGGGGLFTDEKLFAILLWGLHAKVALWYGKQLNMIGQSVGPLKRSISRWVVKGLFNKANSILVRDAGSKDLLVALGVKKGIQTGPDLVFGLNKEMLNKKFVSEEGLDKKIEQEGMDGYFVFSLRQWNEYSDSMYTKIIQEMFYIKSKYRLLPVFIAFQLNKESDQVKLQKILEQNNSTKDNIYFSKSNEKIGEILEIIRGAKFVIGMRLHSLIFSYLMNTPCIGISYSPKVKNFMNDAGLGKYVINSESHIERIADIVEEIEENMDEIVLKMHRNCSDYKGSIAGYFSDTGKK